MELTGYNKENYPEEVRPIQKETQLVLLLQKRNRIRRQLCFICAICGVVAVIWSIFCLLTGFAYTIPIFLAATIVLLAVVKFPAGWRYCIQKNWNGPKNFAGIFFFYLILFLVSFLIGPVLFFRDLYKQLQNKGPDF